ncbi:hypothetical protein MATL_G00055820 [Megalops atlanticus]|uniref:Uncharacterized protein n=1 Tax=Megalops atlanticus TaxID=7932 RepID=A0A9D3TH10_MEGAT|nr:hypothetical protein MATL_G00055820 [Megalops atlanticus]
MAASEDSRAMDTQRISAELATGLFLSTAYRICSNIFNLQVPHQCDVTRSLCCVWLASNLKFVLFRRTDPESLRSQAMSRLIAFLALLLNACCCACAGEEQVSALDTAVCSFCILCSAGHLLWEQRRLQGWLHLQRALTHPRQLFLQVDLFATFIFGLLWLAYPDWLLAFQHSTGAESTLHLHVTRAFGAMMVGDSCVSLTAQNLQTSRGSTSVFMGRAVGTVALLVFIVHSQLTASAWTTVRVFLSMAGASLWTGNSILGYLSTKNLKEV